MTIWNPNVRWQSLLFLIAGLVTGCRQSPSASTPATPEPEAPIVAEGLHNVWRVGDKLLSGSSPEGDVGFRSLQALGVRTVISVDGAKPDIELAHQFGLRYVHVPIGYDGVPREQALRIARAIRDLPGLVYLHCHHGKHRGPAAAATAWRCLDEKCGVDSALALMRRAGTDPRYAGLYASPTAIGPIDGAELDRVSADFPEVALVPALAGVMVEIDERWERMTAVRAAGWRAPPAHADLDPPHEALQLREQFREAGRLPDVSRRPEALRSMLRDAVAQVAELETALRTAPIDRPTADRLFERISASCRQCHARFRDAPGSH